MNAEEIKSLSDDELCSIIHYLTKERNMFVDEVNIRVIQKKVTASNIHLPKEE